MKNLSLYLSALIIVALLPFSAFGNEQRVTVLAGEWPPYVSQYLPEHGFSAEIVVQAFQQVGITADIAWKPWKRCSYEVEKGKAFAVFPFFKTQKRGKFGYFSDALASSNYVFFYRKDRVRQFNFRSLSDLKDYRIGGIRGFFYEESFQEAALRTDYAADLDTNFKKLYHGRIDLMPEDELVGWERIRTLFPDEVDQFATTQRGLLKDSPLYLLVSKAYPGASELLQQFNQGLRQLRERGLYQQIMAKYATPAVELPEAQVEDTFPDELPMVIGEYPPYTSELSEGKGQTTKIVSHLLAEMGITPRYTFYPWTRCENMLKQGRAWATFPYAKTPEREKKFWFSAEPLLSSRSSFFYYKPHMSQPPEWTTLEDLRSYLIGSVRGYWYIERFQAAGLSLDLTTGEELAFKMLVQGRIDLLPMDDLVAESIIQRDFPNEQGQFGKLSRPYETSQWHLMVSKEYPQAGALLQAFDAMMKQLRKEEGLPK